jgi:hypothetical protein
MGLGLISTCRSDWSNTAPRGKARKRVGSRKKCIALLQTLAQGALNSPEERAGPAAGIRSGRWRLCTKCVPHQQRAPSTCSWKEECGDRSTDTSCSAMPMDRTVPRGEQEGALVSYDQIRNHPIHYFTCHLLFYPIFLKYHNRARETNCKYISKSSTLLMLGL